MLNKTKNEVLGGLRLVLKLTNLYNKSGVHLKYNKKGDSIKIPDFVIFGLILSPTFYMLSSLLWIVIEEKFDLKLISTSLAGTLCFSQIVISYVLLSTKTDLFISTIDHLQAAVEKSKYLY